MALDAELLRVTPELNRYFEEMQQAVGDRRVIIVRQQGMVSIGSMIALFGALAFHAFLLVVVYFSWKLIIASPWHWGPDKWANLADDGGRPGTTFTMLGEGEFTGTSTDPYVSPINPQPAAAKPAAAALPELTADWPKVPAGGATQDPLPLIGVPSELSFPQHQAAQLPVHEAPTAAQASQSTPLGPVLVGPNVPSPQLNQVASIVHAATAISGTGSTSTVGDHPGGESDDGDEEPTIQITRGQAGHGRGDGSGDGDGVDRGASGANNETPGLLYLPTAELPIKQMLIPAHGKVVFEVMVLADGTTGEIKLIQSCGDSTLDAVYRNTAARARFRPAYRDGKPFAAPFYLAWGEKD